jgi:hypothetical protein
MAARIHQLQQTLEMRNCFHLWKMENMNLWRMTTLDQPEKWFTPSGEELHSCAEVADYLLSLPPGGSRAKLRDTAPSSNWEGLELEYQEPDNGTAWVRARILERLTDSTCRVYVINEGITVEVNLFEIRSRWCNPKPGKVRSQNDKVKQHTGDAQLTKRKRRETSVKRPNLARKDTYRPNSSLKDCVMELRRDRLYDICVKGSTLLEGKEGVLASAIAVLLETAHAQLLELELAVDPSMILLSREKLCEEVVSAFAAYCDNCERKGWSVHFRCIFEGNRAGESIEIFERSNKDYAEGLVDLGRRLNAKQYPVLSFDENWTFYRCLDIIDECDDALAEMIGSGATHVI